MNYTQLLSAIEGKMNRGSQSSVFPLFLELAEADINSRLALDPVRPQHTRASLTADAQYEEAPADILDVDTLYADGYWKVDYVSPQNMDRLYAGEADDLRYLEELYSGGPVAPRTYTKIGTQFRFYPEPEQSFTLSLTYWAKVPALTSGAPTNWMLTNHLPVYWHGVLAHANDYYSDPETAETELGLFERALEAMRSSYPAPSDTAALQSEIAVRDMRPTGLAWPL